MIAKGYNIEALNHQDRLLNQYTNEYGFNLRHKDTSDIFKTWAKPKNIVNPFNKGGKR